MMKRIHAFEFEDQEWLPNTFRNYITELVQHLLVSADIYGPIASRLREALESTQENQVLDLCSGATGPMLQLHEDLGASISITLSDKYPNLKSFERAQIISQRKIGFIEEQIDARAVPKHIGGFRTLFSAFHHFTPSDARRILQDAVENRRPIGVFEFTERRASNFFKIVVFGAPLVWLQTPLVKPFRLGRLFWTYLFPIVPLLYCWDAIISHWRTYSMNELRAFIGDIEGSREYDWSLDRVPSNAGFAVTYLIGTPKEQPPSSRPR